MDIREDLLVPVRSTKQPKSIFRKEELYVVAHT